MTQNLTDSRPDLGHNTLAPYYWHTGRPSIDPAQAKRQSIVSDAALQMELSTDRVGEWPHPYRLKTKYSERPTS